MSLTAAQVIENRRATRKYKDQDISDDVLQRVLDLTCAAPSAFNAQRADVVAVRDQNIKDAIFAASGQQQHKNAPVVLVFLARTDVPDDLETILPAERATWVGQFFATLEAASLRETAIKDAMILGSFSLIAAASEGLATSPTTGYDAEAVRNAIGAPEDRAVAFVVALGYPDETPAHPGRKADRQIINHY
ncbi:nitroreductase family protein [Corynebacterium kutscheri]|uniref:nitroreductase family protein n=1 Tax=Corynebacterium kutscheri TaxID=35755 RepID=UPI0037BFCF19